MHPSARRRSSGAGLAVACLALLFATSTEALGQNPVPGVRAVQPDLPASPTVCAAFQVAAGTVQTLDLPPAPGAQFLLQIWLDHQLQTLQLTRHEVRAPDFRLQVDTGHGMQIVATPPCVTWQGEVLGVPGSDLAVTVVDGQVRGIVIDGDTLWGIQPLRDADPQAASSMHFVYRAADNWSLPYHCGVPTSPLSPPPPSSGGADTLSEAQIACEVDYPQYQRFNNVTNAQNDAIGVINAMDVIYRRDCNITYLVTNVLVRAAPDPYTTTDAGTLLSQFGNWWNANQGGVQRDVAHLFSGRPINGNVIGIAYLGVVCSVGSAYGLTETMYSGLNTNFSNRVGLSSHEVGHNWSAQHCDGSGDCRIMCSGLGGCNHSVTSFSPGEASQISSFRTGASCLQTQYVPPLLTSMTPTTVTAFRPAQITVSGRDLSGATQVQVGSQVGGFSLYAGSDTQAVFTPPAPQVLGTQPVRIGNPSGFSNPLNLTYTATSPCGLRAPAAAIGGYVSTFEFGGQPGHAWFLLLSLLPNVGPLQGQNVLQSYSLLALGQLNPVGLGSFAVLVPPGVLTGAQLFEQVLEVDMTTFSLVSASPVQSTRILL